MTQVQGAHRASALKQQNKKHNVLGHRTKGQVATLSKGRVNAKSIWKLQKKDLSRKQRRQQAKDVRNKNREEAISKKRQLGSGDAPPFLVAVVPLNLSINPRTVLNALLKCDDNSTITNSAQGVTHLSFPRFKQRFSFVVPPVTDLYAILDTLKVSDTILFIWPTEEEISEEAQLLLSCIMCQGLPAVVHIANDLHELSQKKRNFAVKDLSRDISMRFPGPCKLHSLEKDPINILRQIGSQKLKSIFFRDKRSHMIGEKVEVEQEGSNCTMKVHGYVRGQPLSANSLVHIPGWGDFQIARIEATKDPHPLDNKKCLDMIDERRVIEEPDEEQESLINTVELDELDTEQTWPTEEEIEEAELRNAEFAKPKTKVKTVPRGTSDYQAAWILDDDDDIESEYGSDGSSMVDSECDDLAPMSQDDESQKNSDDEEFCDALESADEEYESLVDEGEDGYDKQIDYDEELGDLEKMKTARNDYLFPDEIDTPSDVSARVRFQKYRGLQSFRSSPWDVKENLPRDYARIFQFGNYNHARKRVYKTERSGAMPGCYVIVHLKDIPFHIYSEHVKSQSPLVMVSILPHEQKMSVVNILMKSNSIGHQNSIKSKEKLIFHVGFRRYANCPIFSEHSTGDKHKFFRFFHPGQVAIASMFAPVTFSPCPILVFKERSNGKQDLVATGSVLSVDPNRIVVKRLVLSGHPLKINAKSAVVRYMFFNREDIEWFKPVELRTKWGRRGHIKDMLGTHGHMKCIFDGKLKSQDTILMNLYKRKFPKWNFDPYVRRPGFLSDFGNTDQDICEDEEDSDEKIEKSCLAQRSNNESLSKKRKTVSFLS